MDTFCLHKELKTPVRYGVNLHEEFNELPMLRTIRPLPMGFSGSNWWYVRYVHNFDVNIEYVNTVFLVSILTVKTHPSLLFWLETYKSQESGTAPLQRWSPVLLTRWFSLLLWFWNRMSRTIRALVVRLFLPN